MRAPTFDERPCSGALGQWRTICNRSAIPASPAARSFGEFGSFVCWSHCQNFDVAVDLIDPVMQSKSRMDRDLNLSANFVVLLVVRVS
jgi:hypothetical protein